MRSGGHSRTLLLVAAATLAGLGLRLAMLDDALFADELLTYFIATSGPGDAVDLVYRGQELSPPLYFVLASVSSSLLGTTAEAIRAPSLLAGVATIPVTYLVGTRTVGRAAGVVGAALVALSPFLIFYSTEARPYSLMALLAALSTLALLESLDDGRRRWWIAYAALSCAAMYAHYVAVFVLLAQLIWAFAVRPSARGPLLLANGAAAAAYLAWIPGFLKDAGMPGVGNIEVLHPFGLSIIGSDLAHWVLGRPLVPYGLRDQLHTWLIVGGVALAACLLLLRLRGAGIRAAWPPPARLTLVVLLAVATPVGAILYSSVADSIFLPRNLIASWPGVALAVGALVTGGRGWLRVAAVSLVVGGFAITGARALDADYQRPDYEAAWSFIEAEREPGDLVIDTSVVTPGPLTPLEAVTVPPREPDCESSPSLPIGIPPACERVRGLEAGPLLWPFATEDSPPLTAESAASRVRGMPPGGTLFVVGLGAVPFERLEADPSYRLAPLLASIGPYGHLETRVFPGAGERDVAVYVLRPPGTGR